MVTRIVAVLALFTALGLFGCGTTPAGSAGVSWNPPMDPIPQTDLLGTDFAIDDPDLANKSTAVNAWIGCGTHPRTPGEAQDTGEQVIDGYAVTFDADGNSGAIEIDVSFDVSQCRDGKVWIVYCLDTGDCYWGEFTVPYDESERITLYAYPDR